MGSGRKGHSISFYWGGCSKLRSPQRIVIGGLIKMWQAWVNAILGLWFIVAAFIIAGNKTANTISSLVAGIILMLLSIWAFIRYRGWKNWLLAIIGLWMIVAGFWFPDNYVAIVGNDTVGGTVIIILSLWAWAGVPRVSQPREV